MLAKLYEVTEQITTHMDRYEVNQYVEYLSSLVEGLTNWYIRRSRRRFWDEGMSEDKRCVYHTLYYVLVNMTKLFAPVAPIIAEELNVKHVQSVDDVSVVADARYQPNFNEIRARYPEQIPIIIKAIKSGKFRLSGEEVFLTNNGIESGYDSDVLLVTYHAKEGQYVASNHGIVVALDLEITEELRQEGFARDIVRNIQDTRKQMGCEITDRIELELLGAFPCDWLDYICKETLATVKSIENPSVTFEVEDEMHRVVTIKVKKEN